MRVTDYAAQWLSIQRTVLRPATTRSYEMILRLRIIPVIGHIELNSLTRADIKVLLARALADGLAKSTVQTVYAVVQSLLNAAVEDEVLGHNPAARLGRVFRLGKGAEQVRNKAWTSDQLGLVLETSLSVTPRYYPAFLVMAYTGVRIGEALGLWWEDFDFDGRGVNIVRQLNEGGEVSALKTRAGKRRIDLALVLRDSLMRMRHERQEEALRAGRRLSPWVLFPRAGDEPRAAASVRVMLREALKRVLRAAGLPTHYTPHSFRHTFASLLLQQGKNLTYVQHALGHRSVSITADVYGGWHPESDPGALDTLAERTLGARQLGLDLSRQGGVRKK